MKIEYEVKILDINPEEIAKKLKKLWARYMWEKQQKRYVYDFSPVKPNKWVRLRQKGDYSELTIKEISNDSITWTKELETRVWDFDTMHLLLQELWYTPRAFQENRRISYTLDWVEIEIDFWPKIPVYIEVEGKNQEEVENMVHRLWYKMADTTSINTTKVYTKYGIDLASIKELRF
jgi:adenylate cyclase class 2